jgi:hypothetical protein
MTEITDITMDQHYDGYILNLTTDGSLRLAQSVAIRPVATAQVSMVNGIVVKLILPKPEEMIFQLS